MTFEIIKNAEIPVNNNNNGPAPIYPFAKLSVGDGFDAPRDMGSSAGGRDKRQGSIRNCAFWWSKRHNPTAKFTVRILNETTIRCVRIA